MFLNIYIYIYIYIYKQQSLLAKWLNMIYEIECKLVSGTAVLKRQCKEHGEVAQFIVWFQMQAELKPCGEYYFQWKLKTGFPC